MKTLLPASLALTLTLFVSLTAAQARVVYRHSLHHRSYHEHHYYGRHYALIHHPGVYVHHGIHTTF